MVRRGGTQRRGDGGGQGGKSPEKRVRWVWWIIFVALSLACVKFSVELFPVAFPMSNLAIPMQRAHALTRALDLAQEQGWRPVAGEGFRQAATFAASDDVQNFFELEEGLAAWQRLLMGTYDEERGQGGNDTSPKQILYYPYTWNVRHFEEGNATELFVYFGPDGRPCGFEQILPEDEPGLTIDHAQARSIAETAAKNAPWSVQFELFDAVESSQKKHLGGRTDHTFTYERKGLTLGKEGSGRFQLQLVIGGDKLTELSYSVKIPESFERRFAEMRCLTFARSYNNTIAAVASIAMVVLFIIIGYGMGLFYLMRQGWVIWKPALVSGVFVGFLLLLSSLNELPLSWMEYDTAESASTFMANNIFSSLATFVGASFWFFLSYMAAESLSRRAYPHHPQIWRLWEAAQTSEVISRVFSGYLLVPVFFAYEILLYLVCQRELGWWVPSSVHEHPDILATYLPWVSSIALSLQAGSWEECCFRAVPLSIAALIGRRFKCEKVSITIMMLIQAVIFGAAHANYPSMPSWARLAELILPSILFGGVYLQYGLLPSIVLHFVFDVVWFALPLFATPAIVDQSMVIILATAPLWLVIGKWALSSRRSKAPLNAEWRPATQASQRLDKGATKTKKRYVRVRVSGAAIALLVILTAAGMGAWVYGHIPSRCDTPSLDITRSQAIERAKVELLERYQNKYEQSNSAIVNQVVDKWYVIASVIGGECEEAEGSFVWESEGGREGLARVMSAGYLEPPQWRIKFVRFDTQEPNVTLRAERFSVAIKQNTTHDALLHRLLHKLPESRGGANLTRDQAELIARNHVLSLPEFSTDHVLPESLELISSRSEKQPHRLDWHFTYADRRVKLQQGEARIQVEISGDEVTDYYLYVHVPEEWRRERQSSEATMGVIRQVCNGVLILGFVVVFVIATIRWSTRGQIDPRVFKWSYLLLMTCFLLSWVNNYPTVVESKLDTSEPLYNQVLVRVGVSLLKSLTLPFLLALILAHLHYRFTNLDGEVSIYALSPAAKTTFGFGTGLAWAGLSYGVRKLILHYIIEDTTPSCASFDSLSAYYPAIDIALGGARSLFATALIFFLLADAADGVLSSSPSKRYSLGRMLILLAAFLVSGGVLEGASLSENATHIARDWVVPSLLFGIPLFILHLAVLSRDRTIVPAFVAALIVLDSAREAVWAVHHDAVLGLGLSVMLTGVLAYKWIASLQPPALPTDQTKGKDKKHK